MKQLKKRLIDGLRQNPNLQIERELIWTLPVQMIKVDYETVQQSKMDILMKMILKTIQQATFTSIEQLVDVLMVESLFVKHMLDKMEGAQIIHSLEEGSYELTEKGLQQLSEGLFTTEAKMYAETMLYSSYHQAFIENQSEIAVEEQIQAEYRHYNHFSNWEIDDLSHQEVEQELGKNIQSDQSHIQTIISSIDEITLTGMDFIPCIEFVIYDWKEKAGYTKIWNTYRNEWDEILAEKTMQLDRAEE